MKLMSIIRSAFFVLSFLIVTAIASAIPATGGAVPAQAQSTWTQVWGDDFNGAVGSAPDSTKWGYDIGGSGWGNGELEYYTNSTTNAQIVADSGALDGKALAINTIYSTNTGLSCWYGACTYTSARLQTQGKFTATYGKIEIRAKVPTAPGLWPAFWMLGSNVNTQDAFGNTISWPLCGEMDIMEQIGLHPNVNYGTLHGPGYSGSNGLGGTYTLPSGNFADAYHTFDIEWEPSVVRFYVDGNLYETHTAADVPNGPYWWVYNHPFFILLNQAVGNNANWPGTPDPTKYPQTMLVDYVHVFQKTEPTVTPYPAGNEAPYGGTPAPVPGQIEAENYDTGGEMVAYHDWDPGNNGGVYRTDDVDIQATTDTGGGYNLAWIVAGDWTKYTVNVQTTGTYTLNMRVANVVTGGTYHFEVDGNNITGPMTIPNTGGWQTWTTVSKSGISLTAGIHVVKFQMDVNNGNQNGNGNLNWFSFVLNSAGGPSATPAPNTPTVQPPTNTPPAATATKTNTPAPTNTPSAGCGTTNIALNKTATASSTENAGTPASAAVDGNTGTRWSSAFSDPQWLQVDLGSTQSICKVTIMWETAYGKSYQIQTSNDAATWTTIYSTTTGAGGTENLNVSGSGRYIRMYGTVRATQYGYSIWEFQVYSGAVAPTSTPIPPTATKTNTPVSASATPTASGSDGTPYGGTPWAIPGTVQAENYNVGGNNVAYGNTGSTTNQGGQYRTDGVGIEVTSDTGGGYDVGWIQAGEWLKYTVNVTTAGSYSANFRVSSPYSTTTMHLEVDGVNVTRSLAIPNTGGWQTWATVTKTGISLTAGQHVMRWVAETNGMNFNWFSIQ